jgi:hypothetical protein
MYFDTYVTKIQSIGIPESFNYRAAFNPHITLKMNGLGEQVQLGL